MKFIVETSARHVHVTQEHLEILFGKDYVLTKKENYQRALDILEIAGYEIVG